jgi:hypothetical protein
VGQGPDLGKVNELWDGLPESRAFRFAPESQCLVLGPYSCPELRCREGPGVLETAYGVLAFRSGTAISDTRFQPNGQALALGPPALVRIFPDPTCRHTLYT